ncbi:MAG TPA: hypothetical protein VLE91_01935 [Candidatus Saccharimonadales bacterium]|nr:hypothetical protein [Candidatus Saccharimonadales bacterium]
MKRGFILPILIILLLSTVSPAVFFYLQNKKLTTELKTIESTNQQLTEQINGLRDYHNIQPQDTRPNLASLSEKIVIESEVSPSKLYTLDCIEDENKTLKKYDWFTKTKNSLEDGEKFEQLCFNDRSNEPNFQPSFATLFTSKQTSKGGMGKPAGMEFRLYLINTAKGNPTLLGLTNGSYLSGCTRVIHWAKSGDLYYTCSSGDGAQGTTSIYKMTVDIKNYNY